MASISSTCRRAASPPPPAIQPSLAINAPIAARVKRETGIATRTVGLIITPALAESIVAEGKADMVAFGRAMLDDPRWGWHAARALGAEVPRVPQYQRAGPKLWSGAQRT